MRVFLYVRLGFAMAALTVLAAGIAACGADPAPTPTTRPTATSAVPLTPAPAPTTRPTATSAVPPTLAPSPTSSADEEQPTSLTPKFDALVERAAAASNKEIIGWFEHLNEEVLELWEDAWEEDFGFRITIRSTPGHYSRESAVQILTGYESGTAVGDYAHHAPTSSVPNGDKGAFQRIDWEPLEEGYPIIKQLRANVPDITLATGYPMSDYCMAGEHVGYTWVFNTTAVSPEEVKGLKLEDVAQPEWKDRFVMGTSGSAGSLLVSGGYPGWDQERFENLVRASIANGARVSPGGGTAGMLGMVISGEADIALGSVNWALNRAAEGAPLAVEPLGDGVIPIHVMTACVPTLTKTDPALAQLFMGWRVVRGNEIQDEYYGTGTLFFKEFPNPVTELLQEAGIRFPEDAVTYRTREQTEFQTSWARELRKLVAGTTE